METEPHFKKIAIDKAKLAHLIPKFYAPNIEQPLLALPVDFKLKPTDSNSNGILILTRIALYLFTSKIFGAPEFTAKINLLRILVIIVRLKLIVIDIDNSPSITIKTVESGTIAAAIQALLQGVFFGLKDLPKLIVRAEVMIPDFGSRQRPFGALKWRSMILSDFLGLGSPPQRAIDCFQGWERMRKPILVLGVAFEPENVAAAIGEAIGCESEIDSVCFQGNSSSQFSAVLQALVVHSCTVVRIVFADYTAGHIPTFGQARFSSSKIVNWWFVRCAHELILTWLDFAFHLPAMGCEKIALVGNTFEQNHFRAIIDRMMAAPATGNLRRFELSRTVIKPFRFPQLVRIFEFCQRLEVIVIRGIDVDASGLLSSICNAGERLRSITFSQMDFKSEFEQINFPKGLLHLGLSRNVFAPAVMISLLKEITRCPMDIPIILEASELVIKPAFYKMLSEIAFDQCYPNIAELDWSNNQFPADSRFFFAFLFTQKRLRLLGLVSVRAQDPMQFLQLLMQLGVMLPLYGLDLSGLFEPLLFAEFLQALVAWPSLRRLNVSGCAAGDGGLGALNEVTGGLLELNELGADGFRPGSPESLAPLWTTVATLPNLVACDLPIGDMDDLAAEPSQVSVNFPAVLANLKSRARLSTVEKRLHLTRSTIVEGKEPEFSDEIFLEASQMDWSGEGYIEGEDP
jgi:hypothetical protein